MKHATTRAQEFGLTAREDEILAFLMQGLSNREIADRCFICEQTVKDHLRHIYVKLGVHRRVAAIALLMQFEATGSRIARRA